MVCCIYFVGSNWVNIRFKEVNNKEKKKLTFCKGVSYVHMVEAKSIIGVCFRILKTVLSHVGQCLCNFLTKTLKTVCHKKSVLSAATCLKDCFLFNNYNSSLSNFLFGFVLTKLSLTGS